MLYRGVDFIELTKKGCSYLPRKAAHTVRKKSIIIPPLQRLYIDVQIYILYASGERTNRRNADDS